MPQMSPIYWSILFIYFILIMFLMTVFIYFCYYNSASKMLISLKDNKLNWLW
uniref:ATP synthase complex subunit 8 n=1 Tax=Okanagana oregona TaxID=2219933 RepID=A0A3S7MER0_9HEMI|nr:ATP synthase F0 subunit 8 [Okanagana oregona]